MGLDCINQVASHELKMILFKKPYFGHFWRMLIFLEGSYIHHYTANNYYFEKCLIKEKN